MSLYLTKAVNIPLCADEQTVRSKLCKLLKIKDSSLRGFRLHKKSVDARNKSDVHFVCSYEVECGAKPANAEEYVQPTDVLNCAPSLRAQPKCVVVGAGPAGLFCARYLAECGADVTVIERGSDVEKRKKIVGDFFNGGEFSETTNVQFGLGGAGAFSDGKLTTGISSPLVFTVFDELVKNGAPKDILTDALPHVGTDRLVNVVASMRDGISNKGGKFLFETKAVDLLVRDGNVVGVKTEHNGNVSDVYADCVVLACGHSARDTFFMLDKNGAKMEFKPFAAGVRVEHTREFINRAQYGELFATHRDLSSASYKLVNKCADGRGCYSFCMCPGGIVVVANSEKNSVVVNGMSNYDRLAPNSNSALVVTVSQDDVASYGYGRDKFAGIRFQEDLERKAYNLGGGSYVAPCQNVADFVANNISKRFDVASSYPRGVKSANLRELLPRIIADDIAESLVAFDRKIKGFKSCGILVGVETRTSSPVRILRGENYMSNLENLYTIGEGAGYSGGIVSSAVDGLKAAMKIAERFSQ
ncbi:MAG: FAD-dependent oxidoreductase [Corallococcus sp.]|nr:FAD-dependent oxidoreductase [Corallococcus sp.]